MSIVHAKENVQKKIYSSFLRKSTPGFSFMELILVVGIISMLMLAIIPQVQTYRKKSKIAQAKLEMRQFNQAIDHYQSDTNQYPSTLTDLVKKPADVKNWSSEYVPKKKSLKDPWGNKYKYERNSEDAEHPYELFSYGPEGRNKGSKEDIISVWDEQ